RLYIVKNSGSGTVTMATTGGATIDGAAASNFTLAPSLKQCFIFVCNGTNWLLVGSFGGIFEAPNDDKLYARRDKTWFEMITVSATAPSSPYTGQFWFDIS